LQLKPDPLGGDRLDDQTRDIFALIAELGFVFAGFSAVAMSLRSAQDDARWPAATRIRAQSLLFSSLLPGMLSLLVLGLAAGGMPATLNYRVASFLWAGATVPFTSFAMRRMRELVNRGDSAVTTDAWGILLFAMSFLVSALQLVNVFILGAFWPVFTALFFHLFSAADVFFRLMFRGPR